jgi:type IV pilus assembly protein PilP
MMRSRLIQTSLLVALALFLAGCSDDAEIRDWMAQTKKQTQAFVPKIPPPKTFAPFTYSRRDSIDPFNPVKLSAAIAKLRAKSGKGISPNLDRRREPLEQFPLDTIKMVGLLQKPGLTYAVLKVDKSIFQAKVGSYVGQNFGMITAVTETGADLKEIVQDASGEWVERKARLELQESSQQAGKPQESKK